MEELYVESFSKRSEVSLKRPIIKESKKEDPLENPSVVLYEITNQMSFYLDQLEKAIFNEFENFSQFQFFFEKVRTKLDQKNTEGIDLLLEELEDLLDLS